MTNTFFLGFEMTLLQQPSFVKLKRKLGHKGIGIFFDLFLKLAISPEYKLKVSDIEDLAYDMHIDDMTELQSVIFDFGIFQKDKDFFWSESVIERMQKLDQLRLKNAEKGKKSAEKKKQKPNNNSTAVEPQLNNSETAVQQYNIIQYNTIEDNSIQLKVNEIKSNPMFGYQRQLVFPILTENLIDSTIAKALGEGITEFNKIITWLTKANQWAIEAGAKQGTTETIPTTTTNTIQDLINS